MGGAWEESRALEQGVWRGPAMGHQSPASPGPGDFMREPKVYEDLTDLAVLKAAMETALREYNLSPAAVPMQLVLFREAVEHSEQPPCHPRPAPRWRALPLWPQTAFSRWWWLLRVAPGTGLSPHVSVPVLQFQASRSLA